MTGIRQLPGTGQISTAIVGTALCWLIGLGVCGFSVLMASGGSLITWLCSLLGLLLGASVCGWARVASARWKLRLAAALILAAVATLFAEAGLRMGGTYPRRSVSRLLPDAGVGFTLDPARADVDRHGFRNLDAVSGESPQVIAIGDGLTEGVNVDAYNSWPACLQRLLNVPVYNMGVSCFGPREYLRAVTRALDKRPQHIVICLNLADDFGSCMEHATTTSPDDSLRQFIKSRTALGSYLHHAWRRLSTQSLMTGAHDEQDAPEITAGRKQQLQLCRKNTDLASDSVRAQVARTVSALSRARQACATHNVRLTLLLVPVREAVCAHRDARDDPRRTAPASDTGEDHLIRLICRQQQDLVDQLTQSLTEEGITVVDVLPVLQSSQDAGQQPFTQEEHGYPSAAGYAVYASVVAQALAPDTANSVPLVTN